MVAAATDMLQVGFTDTPIPTVRDVAVSDLKELADLLAPHNFRLAYENWCRQAKFRLMSRYVPDLLEANGQTQPHNPVC
ncbi:hypothetical protein ABVK25_004563 [Lepraria finkii]|uniref:Uncharacterized protein n=1 Tax=Lepraria finkii TaxID=1340010 RepID=A0ABR4BBV2_9LECA